MKARPCATEPREPCQAGNRAALSGSLRVPRVHRARAGCCGNGCIGYAKAGVQSCQGLYLIMAALRSHDKIKKYSRSIAAGFGPPWSARGRGISRTSGSFSGAHVAGKTIGSYSRLPRRELCEAFVINDEQRVGVPAALCIMGEYGRGGSGALHLLQPVAGAAGCIIIKMNSSSTQMETCVRVW